jgi:hypothetical protein
VATMARLYLILGANLRYQFSKSDRLARAADHAASTRAVGNPVPTNQTVNTYYNINAFNPVPAPGRIGNCGVGSLEGPGTASIAAGLAKTFALGERVHLRFEATFTNC